MKVAVLGAGHGGVATAADLSLRGHSIRLFEFEKFKETLEPIIATGSIDATGLQQSGTARMEKVTTNVKEAVKGAQVIFIVTTALMHSEYARACAPHLEEGQVAVTFGKGGGSLELMKAIRARKKKIQVLLGETNTLPYLARKTGPTQVNVTPKKGGILISAFPSKNNKALFNRVRELYPQMTLATNILETILVDYNALGHPATYIVNWAFIERSSGEFYIVRDGVTPSVARIMEAVDNERLAIMKALGLKPVPRTEWLYRQGFAERQDSLYEMYQKSTLARQNKIELGPAVLKSRAIIEDIPEGLVTMASIGDLARVATPTIKALVTLASVMNETDYWKQGRTVERLGFGKMNLKRLKKYVTEGPA